MTTFSGRVEAKTVVPTGGAAVSATVATGAGAYTATVPAASYYLTSAGGVSSLLTALQGVLNTGAQSYPQTAAALAAAIGYGTWTTGAAWLCNESSGNLAPIFGSGTMTAVGTPVYSTAGPAGGVDTAVSFNSTTDGFSGGNIFNVGATDDLFVVWVGRNNTATVTADVITKMAVTPRWGVLRENSAMGLFTTDATPDTVYPNASGVYIGSWHVGIAYIDRGATVVGISTRALVGGTPSSASASSAALGDLTNAANNFRFGDGGLYRGTNSPDLAFVGVVTGSGVAASLHSNISTALNNFAGAINAAWAVSLSTTTGLVSINWSGYVTPTWSLTWTSTALRDVLGFTANISGVTTTQTGTQQARGLWLPDCPLNMEGDPERAPTVSDARQSMSPTGQSITLVGNTFKRHRDLVWSHVPIAQVWDGEATYENGSWEEFFTETQLGLGSTWFTPGSPIQIYDHTGILVGADATITGWSIIGVRSIEPKKSVPGWSGLWRIEIGQIVAVGS